MGNELQDELMGQVSEVGRIFLCRPGNTPNVGIQKQNPDRCGRMGGGGGERPTAGPEGSVPHRDPKATQAPEAKGRGCPGKNFEHLNMSNIVRGS